VTSADIDRDVKIPLYARAGIPDVWLVDLEADTVEIYREPGEDGYAVVRTATRDDALVPLHLANVTLSGADILG
jgi:Uma2 family endonuclease